MRKTLSNFFCSLFVILCFSSCTKKNESNNVVLKIFSNLPDRQFGQGYVEQLIIDKYMEENPNVKIEVETLDENAYKTKFKAYCMEDLPDIISIWGQNSFIEDAINGDLLLELNESDYNSYGFKENSLDGFKKNNKLYGLPRNTDIALLYYNEKLFKDYGFKIPETFEELLSMTDEINSHNVTPIAMDGSDGWPILIFISEIFYKLAGQEYETIIDNAFKNHDFSNKYIRKSLEIFIECCNKGLFQKNFEYNDYGTAQNLFLSGKAAMYYMGSWESSMAVNKTYWDYVTDNLRVITLPPMKNERKAPEDVLGWYGGGYAISKNCTHKEEALKFFNYMFKPENLSYLGYINTIGISAQNQEKFKTENNAISIQQLVNICSNAKHLSGTPINDKGSSNFKQEIESNIQRLATGEISVDDFINLMNRESTF